MDATKRKKSQIHEFELDRNSKIKIKNDRPFQNENQYFHLGRVYDLKRNN